MHLSEEQRTAYGRDGYLILEDVLTAEECEALAQEAECILDEVRDEQVAAGKRPEDIHRTGVYVGLSVRSNTFRQLMRRDAFVDPLEDIWGPEIGFLSDKIVFKSAAIDFGSPWHQDWSYWKGSHKISLWVALDDATPENGCLLVVPGSHRQEIDHDHIPSDNGFANRLDLQRAGIEGEPVAVPLRRGSALLFHDLLLHASHGNRSGAPRRALIITYRNLAEPDLDYPALPAAEPVRSAGTAAG